MTFDFDDFHEHNHRLDLLWKLKEINPAFRCTAFAVPALGRPKFWASIPEWIELAVHGWLHPSPFEAKTWSRRQMEWVIEQPVVQEFFVTGFKAPGWQISQACYEVLAERGWWVADQHLEDHRRPSMRTYFYEDGNWHGHIQNVCGNGIEETWAELSEAVARETDFPFCSEAARLCHHGDDPRASGVPAGAGAIG